MSYRYRLYLGGKEGDKIIPREQAIKQINFSIEKHDLGAYTLYDARGYWNGHEEPSYVLEILADDPDDKAITHIAYEYKQAFNQDYVLITTDLIEMRVV